MYTPSRSIYTPMLPRRVARRRRPYLRIVSPSAFRRPPPTALAAQEISLPQTPPEALPQHVSAHSLGISTACERKHYWGHILGLYPTGQSVHLIAGASFAAGTEAARRYAFAQADPAAARDSDILAAAFDAFTTEWGDYQPPDHPRLAKTFAGTFQALRHYLETYHPGRDELQPLRRPDGAPAVEYKFAVPLPVDHPCGDPFLLVGRFDMLASYNFAGMDLTVPVDEKTTTSIGVGWADSWSLDLQMLTYIWALRAQGYDISHAVVRGIAIMKTDFKVQTALVNPNDDLMRRFEARMLAQVRRMKEAWIALRSGAHRDQVYPFIFNKTCNDFGGCAYRALCEPPDPEAFYSNYTLHRWNPTAKQPVEDLDVATPTTTL